MNQSDYRANRLLEIRLAEIRDQLNNGVITGANAVDLTAEAQDRHAHAVYRAYAAAGDHLHREDDVPYIMLDGQRVDGEYYQLVERLIEAGIINDYYAEI